MLTRRRFLGYTGAGMLGVATGCTPHFDSSPEFGKSSAIANLSLAAKRKNAKLKNHMLGYPLNMKTPPDEFFAWRRQLQEAGIGNFAYNNVGNPNEKSSILFNTHDFERELILKFGELFKFPEGNTWGFLSHSGTDSNMHGMYMGRTLLKERTGSLPKAYFTLEAHYSVQILRDLLGVEAVNVGTLPDGGMDPDDLRVKLALNASSPALVVATIGTTFKGAIDRLDRLNEALEGHPSYLHLDAALFGGYLPFTSHADELFHLAESAPSRARYDSIAVSCHKFFGFPSPAGLFITTRSGFEEFNELFSRIHNPEYIHQIPGTITCSRDAVKPAEFYYFSTPSALSMLSEMARSMLQNTDYLMKEMQNHFSDWQPARANPLSNTIFFRKPGDRMVKKYSLATTHSMAGGTPRDFAHVVIMPHADRQVLAEFLSDLEKDSPGI
ncbi:MAG: pyridoxal-dependent decarboxylase [Gammaproteobacteria bacterium]